jgi:hypothetical protein
MRQPSGLTIERSLGAQPLNRARKSATAYHHRVVLMGMRRTWTATMTRPPMTYVGWTRPRVRRS